MIFSELFDSQTLLDLAGEKSKAYGENTPFPHIYLDNVLNSNMLLEARDRFPSAESLVWYRYNNPLEKKLATNRLLLLDPVYRKIFLELNSKEFIDFLEKLTGIQNLIPDPLLNGGGLHQILPGGKLDIHADYNYHPLTKLDRRINVLIYLNSNWKEEYGGHIEFWDKTMSHSVQKILPVFNRMVIFSANDFSYHGHPDPLNCPEGQTRKSLAVYYYTNGRPSEEKTNPHSTVYLARPGDPEDPELEELRKRRAKGRLAGP